MIIHKYKLNRGELEKSVVSLPLDAKVVLFGRDNQGNLSLWAEHNNGIAKADRIFLIAGTGTEYEKELWEHKFSYIDGPFIWHLLESRR